MYGMCCIVLFFFFNDTATTEIYTLSLHDALPISIHYHLIQMRYQHYRHARILLVVENGVLIKIGLLISRQGHLLLGLGIR